MRISYWLLNKLKCSIIYLQKFYLQLMIDKGIICETIIAEYHQLWLKKMFWPQLTCWRKKWKI